MSPMRPPQPRLGTFATIDGVEYPTNSLPADGMVTVFARARENPAPGLLTQGPEPGLWVADVRVEDCERVVSVTTRARWHGELCQVMSIDDRGDAVLYHLDNNRARTVADGFRPLEPGTYARTAPVTELKDYHEFHSDLLFGDWASGV
jgi:hypothetical protein